MSRYPEHDKLDKIKDESQAQGEFIDWLEEQGIILGEYVKVLHRNNKRFMPAGRNINTLLAEYHGIDLVELENENLVMLAAIQSYREEAK